MLKCDFRFLILGGALIAERHLKEGGCLLEDLPQTNTQPFMETG